MRTLGDYISPGRKKHVEAPESVRDLLDDSSTTGGVFIVKKDWTLEQLQRALYERCRRIKEGGLILLPETLTVEEWRKRFEGPEPKKHQVDPRWEWIYRTFHGYETGSTTSED